VGRTPRISRQDITDGLALFLVGFFKKVALADARLRGQRASAAAMTASTGRPVARASTKALAPIKPSETGTSPAWMAIRQCASLNRSQVRAAKNASRQVGPHIATVATPGLENVGDGAGAQGVAREGDLDGARELLRAIVVEERV
jgi:hypothetical protein